MVGFNIDFKNIINNINTTLLKVFLYITDVEDYTLKDQLSLILSLSLYLIYLSLSSIWADIKAKCGL